MQIPPFLHYTSHQPKKINIFRDESFSRIRPVSHSVTDSLTHSVRLSSFTTSFRIGNILLLLLLTSIQTCESHANHAIHSSHTGLAGPTSHAVHRGHVSYEGHVGHAGHEVMESKVSLYK